MVDGGVVACATDILIEISHLYIELFATTIADGNIGPVLIKEFSVDGGRIAHVEEDLVLDGGEETLGECPRGGSRSCLCCAAGGGRGADSMYAAEGNNSPGEITEPAGIYMFILYQGLSFCMEPGYIALFQPEPVLDGGSTGFGG